MKRNILEYVLILSRGYTNNLKKNKIRRRPSNTECLGPAKSMILRFRKTFGFPSTPKIVACKIFNFAARKIYDFSTACKNLFKIFAHSKSLISMPRILRIRGLQKFVEFLRDFRALNSLKYFFYLFFWLWFCK